MQSCKPDTLTYYALIAAFERGYQCLRALQARVLFPPTARYTEAAGFSYPTWLRPYCSYVDGLLWSASVV